jgi:hypothetical protein
LPQVGFFLAISGRHPIDRLHQLRTCDMPFDARDGMRPNHSRTMAPIVGLIASPT